MRASHFIFCGDGEHGNPEEEVIEGYVKACRKNPPSEGEEVNFWFTCSEDKAADKHRAKWQKLHKRMTASNMPPWLKSTFLTKGASLQITI